MNQRIRIKFCGITRPSDAAIAVALGVDALGFVFHPASPRNIEPAEARAIIRSLPAFVSAVGLFVDAPLAKVHEIVGQTGLSLVQFHGEESPAYCEAYGQTYVKAVRVKDRHSVTEAARRYHGASALLLDTWHPQLAGGTGEAFDWSLVPAECSKPMILAGGLNSANVARAIREVAPFAVDVSGGIEQAKGLKDSAKMRLFVAEVNALEREQ
jgi:phosphoribosylanthranilate isomerase